MSTKLRLRICALAVASALIPARASARSVPPAVGGEPGTLFARALHEIERLPPVPADVIDYQGQVCNTPAACGALCLPCVGVTPVCNAGTLTCTRCVDAADCEAPAPVCEPSGACGPCTNDRDCPADHPFCGERGACGVCRVNSDCPLTAPVCTNGACTGCAGKSNVCPPSAPVCLANGGCGSAVCLENGPPYCPDPTAPACNQSGPFAGSCTECNANDLDLCRGTATPFCDLTTGTCASSTPPDAGTADARPARDAPVADASTIDAPRRDGGGPDSGGATRDGGLGGDAGDTGQLAGGGCAIGGPRTATSPLPLLGCLGIAIVLAARRRR